MAYHTVQSFRTSNPHSGYPGTPHGGNHGLHRSRLAPGRKRCQTCLHPDGAKSLVQSQGIMNRYRKLSILMSTLMCAYHQVPYLFMPLARHEIQQPGRKGCEPGQERTFRKRYWFSLAASFVDLPSAWALLGFRLPAFFQKPSKPQSLLPHRRTGVPAASLDSRGHLVCKPGKPTGQEGAGATSWLPASATGSLAWTRLFGAEDVMTGS